MVERAESEGGVEAQGQHYLLCSGVLSTEKVRISFCRTLAKVTDCKGKPRGNAGPLLYLHPSKIFTDA